MMRLALFQPEIPGNAGAAIRAAACFGAGLDIIEPCGFPADSKGLKRAALDYGALTAPVLHASWEAFLRSPERAAGRLVLLTTKGDAPIWDFKFGRADTLLTGKESAGVPDEVRAACDAALVIPIAAGARSLNAAAAGAIGLAEMRRQIGW
ncbi:MAG: TrmH family RNA methyltransferase [Parvularculaceae bacterium]